MRRKDKIVLKREGIFGESWSKRVEDYVISGIRAGGRKEGEFLWQNRNVDLKVEGDVTLLDLIKILAKMNVEELHALSQLANANLAPYLIDFANNPTPIPDTDKFGKLTHIEVYKTVEFDNHESGDNLYDFTVSTSAHGIGEVWEDVMKEVTSGTTKLEDAKACNSYAIEFTPWQQMLDIPIRIRPETYYTEMIWKKCKPRALEFGIIGSKRKVKMGMMERDLVERKNDKKVRSTMTLAEFFTGLFNELCYFGAPTSRDSQMNVIKGRMNNVEKLRTKGKKKKK